MNFLKPGELRLETAPDGTLSALVNEKRHDNIEIRRALPLSHANEFFALRQSNGDQIGVLESARELDANSQKLLQRELDNRYFLPQITKIHSIFERFGSAQWDVETNRGRTKISTKALHEAIIELSEKRFILRDNEENRYEIPDISALDEASHQRFLGKV